MKVGLGGATGSRLRLVAAGELIAACALIALPWSPATAAEGAKARILSCKDVHGNTIISDPSDPRCVKAPLTPDEQAAVDERKRREEEAYRKCKIEQRDLQTLLSRYPDKEKHDAARRTAMAQLDISMSVSKARMGQLLKERKRLLDEAEFYPKGNLPAKLRRDMDTNDALIAAQAQAIESQKEEAALKNAFYDDQLVKLKKLWVARPEAVLPCVPPRG